MSRYVHKISQLLTLYQTPVHVSVRNYARWMHRKPGKVLLPFEPTGKVNLKKEKVIDLDPEIFNKSSAAEAKADKPAVSKIKSDSNNEVDASSSLSPEKREKIKSLKDQKQKKLKFYLSQKKIFDDNGEIIYEKLNDNDGRVSSLLVKLKSKKNRMKAEQTLVEGWRLIVDGLEAKCKLQYVLFSNIDDLHKIRPFLPKTGVLFYKMPYKEMKLFSDVETPPGIFGIFEIPSSENFKRPVNPLPIQLICDNVRMPGNLGAILRVAAGVGCDKVLLSKGCVDVWDPKVIRSGAGAHFRLPIHHSLEWSEINDLLAPNTSIFIADSNIDMSQGDKEKAEMGNLNIPVLPYYGVEFSTLEHMTLIIGGETEGISEDSYVLAAERNGLRLNIPLQRGVDSLNTGMATAVIAFEMRKQLIQAWSKIRQDKLAGLAT